MSNRMPIPVRDLAQRMPEQGRIRIGVKTNNRSHPMKSIGTFRLTSADASAIKRAAILYGGEAKPWTDAPRPGEWEVITEARTLPILLPPDALGGSPIYELWTAGGIQRRCDGEKCSVPTASPDGSDMVEVDCLCVENGEMICRPKVRLNVILRDLPFGGGWRFETSSWNAVHEMPGMVAAIESLQTRGMTVGLIALEEESQVIKGKTKRFKVVRLRMETTVNEIVAGAASVTALGTVAAPALGRGSGGAPPTTSEDGEGEPADASELPSGDPDDEIVDGEIVDDDDLMTDVRVAGGNRGLETALVIRIKELCDYHEQLTGEALIDDDVRHDLVEQQTRGRTRSSLQMTDAEKQLLMDRIHHVIEQEGDLVFGVKEGKAKIGMRRSADG